MGLVWGWAHTPASLERGARWLTSPDTSARRRCVSGDHPRRRCPRGRRSRGPNRALRPLRRSSWRRASIGTERGGRGALHARRRRVLRRRSHWLEADPATGHHLGRGWVRSKQWSTGSAMDMVAWSFASRGHDVDEHSGSVLRRSWQSELGEGRSAVAWGGKAHQSSGSTAR